ncbi:MAG: hypothetical protein RL344_944 [Pseudomonadota bacterium]|jgi:hypothetical protein
MKLFHPTKIAIRLYVCFVIAFTVMPRVVVATPTMTDPTFIGSIVLSKIEVDLIVTKLNTMNTELAAKAVPAATVYATNIGKIETAVTAELKATKNWIDETKPNIAYQNQLEKLKNDLNAAEVLSDKKLKDIEDKFFINNDALKNMSEVYGKNNSDYKKILYDDKPLCPPIVPKSSGIANKTYTELQVDSCQTVYNAIAYKEEVNNILVNKDKIIDDITNDAVKGIIKLPSKTIGDYNARQTALETVRLLRKVAKNDNDIKVHNAEIEIELAQDERKYAANAILTGPPKSASIDLGVNLAKVALGLAVGTLISETAPFNQ